MNSYGVKVFISVIFSILLSACGGSSEPLDVENPLTTPADVLELSELEETGLLLMREEEKLARDVYMQLYDEHNTNIFLSISESEQVHTDAVKTLLDNYLLADPVGENGVGEFTDIELQHLYDYLVDVGTSTLLDGLYVGARVEELDIYDIERLKAQVIGNEDIVLVYDNLLKGSRNHLRSFHRLIEQNFGFYEPIYITQEQYDEIVSHDMEKGY